MQTIDIGELLKQLPHRYPFLLVDRVLSCDPGVSIRGPAMYTGVFPMLVHGEWMRVASQVRRLRDLVDRVRALERKTKADDDGR